MYLKDEINVLGGELKACCMDPKTGFHRDGYCKTGLDDHGEHVVCAVMTNEYLEFMAKDGNDLTKPIPKYDFPGLKEGDVWCIAALRWMEAYEEGIAPPIILEATHQHMLTHIDIEDLREYEYED